MTMRSRPLRGLLVIGLGLAAIRSELFAVPGHAGRGHLRQAQTMHTDVAGATLAGFPTSVHTVHPGKQEASVVEVDQRASFAGLAPEQQKFDSMSLLLAAAGAATAMSAASAAASEEAATEEPEKEAKASGVKVAIYIGLWYLFNIGYNIYNKKALITYPYPWANALWQMFFGCLIFTPMWLLGIRKAPKITVEEGQKLIPSALGHLATHVGAVIAFFAGAVSFGHIVKASEPVVSSALNFAFMGEVLAWPVYAALVPIIGGVALASVSELSFTWLAFGAAMGSNLGSASRAVVSKKIMGQKIGENMTSSNFYAILTIMATIMLIPITFAIEGPSAMLAGFKAAYAKGGTQFLLHMLYAGFTYYMYNEVAFQALGSLDPVSHAVCNTMKRVVIIVTAVIVFRTPVTGLGAAGSCIAIGGTLLYSLAKNKFK